MDNSDALGAIRQNISDGKNDIAAMQVMDLASKNQDDPMILLTCCSMLRTIGDDNDFPGVLSVLMSRLPSDGKMKYEIASGLIGLGCLREAGTALDGLEESDRVLRARAAVMHGTGRDEEALETISKMEKTEEIDRVLRVQALGSLGRHADALSEAESILKDGGSYRAGRCYISALVLADRVKDAAKYVRERMKAKDADGYALMAYYQWLNGNSTASGAFSSKALKENSKHIGALETIGYSFCDKGAYWEAKVAAGAINEVEPGNPAVLKILAMCRKE